MRVRVLVQALGALEIPLLALIVLWLPFIGQASPLEPITPRVDPWLTDPRWLALVQETQPLHVNSKQASVPSINLNLTTFSVAGRVATGATVVVSVTREADGGSVEVYRTTNLSLSTAAFDLNLLARMNRELGADFRLSGFRHRSVWDTRLSRVEMHLESREAQLVHVAGAPFTFDEGETIHTESAYKWAPRAFDTLAAIAGWRLVRDWTDDRAWFSVRLYERGG